MPGDGDSLHAAGLSSLVPFFTTGSSQDVVGPNPDRIALVLGCPDAGVLTYTTDSVAVAGQGLNFQVGSGSVTLTRRKHGTIVTLGWRAIGTIVGGDAAVIEVFRANRD